MPLFLDSSAVVKYYVKEPGSAWVRRLVDGEDASVLAEITITEVAAALGMLYRMGQIGTRQRRDLWERFERDCVQRYVLTPIVQQVIYAAADLCGRHALRAYDAVQLAAGLGLRAPLAEHDTSLVFVSADDALVAAAGSEGLAVENPYWHTELDIG